MTNKKENIAITNQRSPEEIKDFIDNLDKELPNNLDDIVNKADEDKGGEDGALPLEDLEEPKDEVQDVELPKDEAPLEKEELLNKEPIVEEKQKQELPPIEERYKQSGQEALILHSKNKKILDTIEQAENIAEPTVDELKSYAKEMGTDLDDLDTFSKNMLKESLINKKKASMISNLVAEERQTANWLKKVDSFLEDINTKTNYPGVLNNPEEFKKYCAKKTHHNVDFELLVAGFSSVMNKPTYNKNVLLGRGGGTRNAPPKPTALNEDDAIVYRKKSQKEYMELARKGKFKIEV